jgi:hypothetical protein
VYITTVVLLSLLFIFVPASVTLGIPQLYSILLSLAVFAGFTLLYQRVVDGLISFVYVFTVIGLSIPLMRREAGRSGITDSITIFIFEPGLFILLISIVYLSVRGQPTIRFRSLEIVTIAGAVGFVLWSVLSAVWGNPHSQFSAVAYAVENIHLLILFLVTILVVQQYGYRVVVMPLFSAIASNSIYATGQNLTGQTLGLSYLGEGTRIWDWEVLTFGPLEIHRGLGGGFTGNPRELLPLTLLIVPVLLYIIFSGKIWARAALVLVFFSTIVVNISSKSENGLVALGIVIVFSIYAIYSNSNITRLRKWGIRVPPFILFMTFSFITILSISPDISPGLTKTLSEVAQGNLISRFERNHAGIELVLDSPLFGIGGKNFLPMSEQILGTYTFVHNIILANLTFTGFPGGLFYVLFIIGVFWTGIQASRELTEGSPWIIWISLLLGMIGLYWYAQWEVVHYFMQARFGFWTLAAIIVGSRTSPVD